MLQNGDLVDTIRVGRYDVPSFKKLLSGLGLERDEAYTWARKSAEYKMEQAFRDSYLKGDEQKQEL